MASNHPSHFSRAFRQLGRGISVLVLGTALTLATPQNSFAAEFPTAFETALKLTRAASTYDNINAYPATYQFVIQIPAAAKQSVARISVTVPDDFGAFGANLPKKEDISAFIPTEPDAIRPQVAQQMLSSQISIEGRTVMIDFPEPIPAPQAITVQFGLMRNPAQGGTYLFEVDAFPPGSKAVKQFVGFGRLVFRDNRRAR
jgi:hypothetical protein